MSASETASNSPGWTTVDPDELQNDSEDQWTHDAPPLIAIVGMAARLPGGISSPEEFWQFMIDKRCASAPVPAGRYNVDAFHGTPGGDTQSVIAKQGFFLDGDYLGKVDTSFFQSNRYEQGWVDPQQMLLSEVVWECMESGGQVDWQGKDIGCFVGTFGEDWLDLTAKDTQNTSPLHIVGTGDYAASNRVSFEYDLKGPCMTCRTACSSSLVALHEACQAIALGDCPSAIVGGSSLIFTPTMTTNMSQAGALSPDGICKTFDAEANGYARAEGVCVLYIKKLDDALRDKDPVRGVIRAVATNFDGRTNHITVPSSAGQEALIRKAYRKAHLENLAETAFVECHGTATRKGDVVETTAVADAFGRHPMIIGGVKSNIGHTEGAAGLAGLIKAVLALEHRQIPPNVNFSTPNPNIPFREAGLTVPVDVLPWPADRKERVSVNCFGVGGTNAHVIVESAASLMPAKVMAALETNTNSPRVLPLSASCPESLDQRVMDIMKYLTRHPQAVPDLAYTLSAKREHLRHRAFAVTGGGIPLESIEFTKADNTKHGSNIVTFAFPGQGTQWAGMGTELMKNFTSFRRDIEYMDQILQSLSNAPTWRMHDELVKTGPRSDINRPDIAQPLCTAVQISLVNLLRTWGITPDKVIGHSSGEFAAAYAANALSMDTAIILAYTRGLVAKMAPEGGMLAVGVGRDEIGQYIAGKVALACENSSNSVTLAGERIQLEQVANRIQNEQPDILIKMLPVERAYHSAFMASVGAEYEELTRPHLSNHKDTMVPMYSTVSGAVITRPSELDAAYWRRSLESPVLFSSAFRDLAKSTQKSHQFVVEIGPNSALRGPIQQILRSINMGFTYCSTMRSNESNISRVLSVAGTAYANNLPVDLLAVNDGYEGEILTDLPPYPWQRENIPWAETRISKQWRLRQFPRHELLGARCLESNDFEPAWRNVLRSEEVPWINHHRLMGLVIFPAVGYVALASEAIRQITGLTACTLEQVMLMEALVRDENDIEIMTTLRKMTMNATMDSDWYEFTVCSYNGQGWTKHCSGKVMGGTDQPLPSKTISEPFTRRISSYRWYRRCEKKGLEYGSLFEGLQDITASPLTNAARGRVEDDRESHDSYYAIHPTIVDQCLQVMLVASDKGVSHYPDKAGMPLYIDRVYLAPGSSSMLVEATTTDPTRETLSGYFKVVSESTGDVVLEMKGLRLLPIPEAGQETKGPKLATHIQWKPDIRFLPATQQVPSPVDLGQQKTQNLAIAGFLLVFELIEALAPQTSLPSYLENYRKLSVETGKKILQGEYDHIPGVAQMKNMNREQRKALFKSLQGQYPDARVERCYNDAWVYASERPDQLISESIFQDTSLLGTMKGIVEWGLELYDWKRFLGPLSHANPGLRVLEVGAGAGSATRIMLEALTTNHGDRLFSQFTVTDSVPGLVSQLEERFENIPKLEYKTLDISKSATDQGFTENSYDLLIVCNVLYETPVLSQSLAHIRSLLAPGGRLLLYEPCSEIPHVDVVMGSLPSWWLGMGDNREGKPHVSVERWEQELCRAGFSGLDGVQYNAPAPLYWQALMLSTKPVEESSHELINLLCTAETRHHPWIKSLAVCLSSDGYDVHWCTFGEAYPTENVIALLDLESPFLHDISKSTYSTIQSWMSSVKRLLWVTHSMQIECEDPQFCLILGLVRTLRCELNVDIGTCEIDSFDDAALPVVTQAYKQLGMPIAGTTIRDFEFIMHRGVGHTGRAALTKIIDHLNVIGQPGSYQLDIQTIGDLSSLGWKPIPIEEVGPHDVEVKASYLALNFKDLMMSLGVVERTKTMDFSFEGSGLVTRVGSEVTTLRVGDPVVVFDTQPMKTLAVFPVDRVTPAPKRLTLAEAAATPSAYLTAIYTLIVIGKLHKGQSVLIHSACGAVGLAALHVCQIIGAEVFASVGSDEKVKYLMKAFGIPRSHILDSHSVSFLSGIMRETNGRGVDLVLNSLAGELLRASWSVADDDTETARWALDTANKKLDEATYLPLLHTIYQVDQVEDAMRQMQKGQHIGKFVIEMPDDESKFPLLPTQARFSFSPTSSYLLVGGLRGIGRAVVRWMVEHGARDFVFLSRSAGSHEEDHIFSQELESQGCRVVMVAGSVTDADAVRRATQQYGRSISGVIQMSAVLKDQLFDKMSHEDWTTSLATKVQGTLNIHRALQDQSLDFFIVFSSAVSMIGNPGQANYAAANSFLDGFVQYRRGLGLPASLVSLGPVDEMGLMSQQPDLLQKARQASHHMMGEGDVLKAFQLALLSAKDGLSSTRPPVVVSGLSPAVMTGDAWLQQDARFSTLKTGKDASTAGDIDEEHFRRQFLSLRDDLTPLIDGSCEALIIEKLGEQIATHNGLAEEIGIDQYGSLEIDSLMGLQIKHWLRRKVEVEVSLGDVIRAKTVGNIAKLVVESLRTRYGVKEGDCAAA
ncbi:polyketide synthase-nonribosomal peptide synthetase [Aspergillus awamori]|uniref:Polyketide synthase-nonribosomal peptide synthetase n=1 Tax=Aspergillus awamori TaxID=105351 RepID=A0A401KFX9_ASPAW|nr:polyketide synthase-nonribosomal peptide synthetase [Aspergillus awamori]